MLAGLLAPSALLGQMGQSGSVGVLKMFEAMKGQNREKFLGLLGSGLASGQGPMAQAGANISQFTQGLDNDRSAASSFAGDLLAQRHGSLGGIERSMAATRAAQGIGNRYSGQGTPNPGDWMPSPDGGRLVWSDKGMWEYR